MPADPFSRQRCTFADLTRWSDELIPARPSPNARPLLEAAAWHPDCEREAWAVEDAMYAPHTPPPFEATVSPHHVADFGPPATFAPRLLSVHGAPVYAEDEAGLQALLVAQPPPLAPPQGYTEAPVLGPAWHTAAALHSSPLPANGVEATKQLALASLAAMTPTTDADEA